MTGAASGIGRATSLGLLEGGIDVAAVEGAGPARRTEDGCEPNEVQGRIADDPADLTDPTSFDTIVSAVLGESGRIDVRYLKKLSMSVAASAAPRKRQAARPSGA